MTMQQIREWLFIGKYAETRRLDYLQGSGIDAMLQLADYVAQPDIETLYLAVEDGVSLYHPRIKKGVTFVREQKALGKRILIACGAGQSRSVTFGIAALMEEEGLELFDAYREIYMRHRGAEPHHELILSLTDYYGKPMELLEVWENLHEVRKSVNQAGV
jgi:hypothetical protein